MIPLSVPIHSLDRPNVGASSSEMDRIRLYTCMVGKTPTHANFYVNDVSEMEGVVARLAGGDASAVAEGHETQTAGEIPGRESAAREQTTS